eukprot:c47118_g1_i1 orf=236-1825(+)
MSVKFKPSLLPSIELQPSTPAYPAAASNASVVFSQRAFELPTSETTVLLCPASSPGSRMDGDHSAEQDLSFDGGEALGQTNYARKLDRESDELPLIGRNGGGFKQSKIEMERQYKGASVGSSVFNLTTTIIGAGIMALPATMKVLGLPLGLTLVVVMGVVSETSVEMLVYFSTKMKAWTYSETVQGACGPVGRALAEICIIVGNGGVLIVYLIIMGDVMSGSSNHVGLFDQWAGRSGWWSDRRPILLLTLILVLAPLASLKKIDSLSLTSALSVALALVFVLLCTAIALVKLRKGELQKPRMLPAMGSKKDILDLLVVVPIMTNAYICHFNVQPIYGELKQRTPGTMNKVGRITTALCVAVYAMTAASGYFLFGEATASDVLINFDKDLGIRYGSLLNNIIRVGYVIHLMLVFPVIHFSLRQAVDSFLFPRAKLLADSNRRFFSLTFLLLSLTYLGSTLIPNIWIAFQLTGATTGLSMGFIFPALIGIKWNGDRSKSDQGMMILSWVMLITAVVSSIIGVAGNVVSLES